MKQSCERRQDFVIMLTKKNQNSTCNSYNYFLVYMKHFAYFFLDAISIQLLIKKENI